MSRAIENLYKKGSVNSKRVATDRLFIDENEKNEFKGIVDKTARFIEEFQLMNAEDWKRFVEQFRVHSDTDDHGWRGEYWGKMMRGACFVYSYTKNPELFNVLKATVEDMMTATSEYGRVSTYGIEKEFTGWDMWARKYVMLGMQYFIEICADEQFNKRIIEFMKGQADYVLDHIGEGKLDINQACAHWRGLPSSSYLEPIVRLYDLTGEKKYLDFASYIVGKGCTTIMNLFELAYEDTTDPYQYPMTKAYELTSCFEGLLEYYRATGIEKHRETVIRYARRLARTDITIIGSAGCTHELFDHSAARQADPNNVKIMQETCVTVTWMKFCMQLLLLTGEAEFAEYFEQAFYNAYLGAVNTNKNIGDFVRERYPEAVFEPMAFDSYSALTPGVRGAGFGGLKLMPDNHYYGCCVCIGSAGIGMVNKVSTVISENGVAVNMFIPGKTTTVTPSNAPLELAFNTDYPYGGRVEITVTPEKTEEFTISLRIPSWSRKTSLSVNGEKIAVAANGNGFYRDITRAWSRGDKIELLLDMRVRALYPEPVEKDILVNDIQWGERYMVPHVAFASPETKFHIALARGVITLARDARLDGTVDEAVDVAVDGEGFVAVTPSDKAEFNANIELSVPENNGKSFTVVDYASAGQTWNEKSKYCCWIPTREYWRK